MRNENEQKHDNNNNNNNRATWNGAWQRISSSPWSVNLLSAAVRTVFHETNNMAFLGTQLKLVFPEFGHFRCLFRPHQHHHSHHSIIMQTTTAMPMQMQKHTDTFPTIANKSCCKREQHTHTHQIVSMMIFLLWPVALKFRFQFIDRMIFDNWMHCTYSYCSDALHDKFQIFCRWLLFFSWFNFCCCVICSSFFFVCWSIFEQCQAFLRLLFVNFALFVPARYNLHLTFIFLSRQKTSNNTRSAIIWFNNTVLFFLYSFSNSSGDCAAEWRCVLVEWF